MGRDLALGEWALDNVGEICDDTEDVRLAEFVQTLSP